MRVTWVLLATIAMVWSQPLTAVTQSKLLEVLSKNGDSRNFIEELLWDVIESLRETILHGAGAVPPLDPLEIASLEIGDFLDVPDVHVALRNVSVANLGTFEIDNLSVSLTSILFQRYRVLLDGRIPSLDVAAEKYELDVSLFGFNIFGAGDLKLQIINPKISANLLVNARLTTNGIFLNVMECTVKFSLEAFKPRITGLFGHEGVSDFVNLFLEDLVPSVVKAYEDEITKFLSETVHEFANNILEDLDLGSLISPNLQRKLEIE